MMIDSDKWRSIAKCELHAHLNGCVRETTLAELSKEGGLDFTMAGGRRDRTMSECFNVFKIIGAVTTNRAAIERISREMVLDAAADGIRYLEVRTTPKSGAGDMSHRQYVEAVLAGIRQGVAAVQPAAAAPAVALILSINRGTDSAGDAMRTVELAGEFAGAGVVGLDLGGDPSRGDPAAYAPAVSMGRRQLSLPLAAHFGELPDRHEDTDCILDQLQPQRAGHAVFLHERHVARLSELGMPVEVCLTSNLLTDSVDAGHAPNHPFFSGWMNERRHPVALCTDDWGVFQTTLSREFALVAGHSESHHEDPVDRWDLRQLARSAIDWAFQPGNREAVSNANPCRLVAGPPEARDDVVQWFKRLHEST